MTRLIVIAVAGYVAGLTLGLGVCHAAWCLTSKEHRYTINRRNA